MSEEFIQDAQERFTMIKVCLQRNAAKAYVLGDETCAQVRQEVPQFISLCGTEDNRIDMVKFTTMAAFLGSMTLLRRARIANSFRNASLIYVGGSVALNVPQNLNPY